MLVNDFTICTTVAEHLPRNKQKQSDIFTKVKDYINSYLNLLKVFFYPTRDHFRQANSISEIYLNIFDRA